MRFLGTFFTGPVTILPSLFLNLKKIHVISMRIHVTLKTLFWRESKEKVERITRKGIVDQARKCAWESQQNWENERKYVSESC